MLAADCRLVDAVTRAQRVDFALKVMLAGRAAQVIVQAVERRLLGGRRRRVKASDVAADPDFDRMSPLDHGLQRDPPQAADTLGEIACYMHRKRGLEFPHD